ARMADTAGVLVPVATLTGPRLASSTRLINDLDDHGSNGVSGQQPHPICRSERASPQGTPRLISKPRPAAAALSRHLRPPPSGQTREGHDAGTGSLLVPSRPGER